MQISKNGIGEEYKEEGFYPVIIENPPEEFVGFEGWDIHGYNGDECYGYVVDLENIKENGTKKGYDYDKYESGTSSITFGNEGKDNDVYIYDAIGKVYYAKGYYVEGGVYFSDSLIEEEDNSIINIAKEYDEDNNIVKIIITLDEEIDIVRVNDKTVYNNGNGEYTYLADKNGTYTVTAERDNKVIDSKKVIVNEIKEKIYVITYHIDGATQTQEKKESETIRLIPPTEVTKEGFVLIGFSKTEGQDVAEYKLGAIFDENKDTDLYAVWKEGMPEEYTISFNANGGKGAPSSVIKFEGEILTLPNDIPTRAGYTFTGWSLNSDDEVGTYNAGGAFAEDKNAVLYAIWNKGALNVEIEISPAGAGKVIKNGTETKGNNIFITAIPEKGYEFSNWAVKADSAEVKIENMNAATTKFKMPDGKVSLIAKFKNTDYDYKVEYDANDGTGAPETQYKKHDENITLSDKTPTRNKHAFGGWSDTLSSNEVKYKPGDTYTGNKNLKLYAIWYKGCMVTLDPNGGSLSENVVLIPIGEKYENLPEPTKTGYSFEGWYTEKDGGNKILETDVMPLLTSQTLYAHWSANKYIVKFDSDDGTIIGNTEIEVTYDDTYGELPTADKEGHTFKGWFDEEGNEITKDTKVDITNETTIKAKWEVNSYTITFDSNGGSNVSSITQNYGTNIVKPKDPTKGGYTFAGWDKEIPEKMPAEDMTIKAKWNIITYNITYELNGGTVSGNPSTYTIETDDITLKNPTKEGYTFIGWTGSNGTIENKNVKIEKGSIGDKEYTANWVANTNTAYKVEHYLQNVDGADIENTTNYTLKETENKTGTTDASVTPAVKNYVGFTKPSTKTESVKADGSLVIKYYYKRNSYTITFNSNGGSSVASITAKYEASITLPANPSKTGYTFAGWDKEIPEKMPAEDITINAKWNTITYNISYELNGGTVSENPTTYTIETDDITLKNPSKTGYTFAGWTGSNGNTAQTSVKIAKGSTGNKTYTATWTANENTAYKVEHYLQNVDGADTENDANYTLKETENKTGTTASSVTPAVKSYTGFTSPSAKTETVKADGSLVIKYYYKRNSYTITFNSDGGSSVASITAKYEATLTTPTAPTKTGYTFAGWNPAFPSKMPLNGLSLTATWTANTNTSYKVEHYLQNVDGADTENDANYTLKETENKTGTTASNVTPTVKSYDGFTSPSTKTESIKADGSLVIKYYYKRNSYTITFNSDGGSSVASITAKYEATLTTPTAPTKTGYTFTGWNPSFPSKMPLNGLSLTAKWTVNSYTYNIKYVSKSGLNIGTDTVTNTYGETKTVTPKTFAGYETPANQSVTWDSVTAKTITFTYELITYDITINLDGGSGVSSRTYDIETADITLGTPSKTGYTFTGWTGSNGTTAQTSVKIAKGSTGNKTYTANWVESTNTAYKVEHYKQTITGGDAENTTNYAIVSADTQNLIGTTGVKVTPAVKTYTGFTSPATKEVTIAADGSTVVKYYYKRNSYTISFNTNGGSSVASITAKYEASITLPANPSKTGYTFTGWDKEVPSTMPVNGMTINAKWNAVTYNITYTLNGGSVSGNPTTYTIETDTFTIKNPTRTGYTFAGWTGTGLTTASKTITIAKGTTGNRSYEATWTANTNTAYKVEHYKQTITGGDTENTTNYAIVSADTQNLTGTTGASVTPGVKSYTGFTSPSTKTVTIAADGSTVVKYYYKRNSYTITFNTNGGSSVASITAKYEASITLPANPSKTGYTFAGWDTEIPTTMPAENMTITAKWTPNEGTKYTVYHYFENANDDGYSEYGNPIEKTGTTGASITLANEKTAVTGGTYSKGSLTTGGSAAATTTIAPDGSTKIYLYYTRNKYALTIEKDENVTSVTGANTYKYGQTVSISATLKETQGYTYKFTGWTTTGTVSIKDATSASTTLTMPNGNVTIKATASKTANSGIKYKVYHYLENIEDSNYTKYGDVIEKTGTTDATITLANEKIAITGGTYSKGSLTAGGVTATETTIKADGTTEIHLYYTRNKYTLTVNKDENITSVTGAGTYKYGKTVPITATLGSVTGYTVSFAGWETEDNATIIDPTVINSSVIIPNGNVTVTATTNKTVNSYTITFDTDGGTVIAPITQAYGTAVTAPVNPTKEGYTFAGWSENIPATMPATNKTITASWTANKYTITYNGNGNTGGSTSNSNHTYDTSSALTANGFTKTGHDFNGWNTAANGTGTAYANNASVKNLTATANGEVTLYAQWKAKTYTVRFEGNGGTLDNLGSTYTTREVTYGKTYGETTVEFPSAEWEGYKFLGWFTSATDGTEIKSTTTVDTSASGQTLYAHWEAEGINITYDANGGSFGTGTTNKMIYDLVEGAKISKTENVSADGLTADTTTGYGNNQVILDKIKIPGATALTVEITYQTESTSYDWVCVYDGSVTPSTSNYGSSISGRLGGTTQTTKSYTVQGDTVQIFFKSDVSVCNYYGYHAKVSYEGKTIELLSGTYKEPTKSGYVFLGWSTNSSATTIEYESLEGDIPAESSTLYAVWKVAGPLLSSQVRVGDYVNYPVSYTNVRSTVDTQNGRPLSTYTGWRVARIEDDGTVNLISSGIPVSFCYHGVDQPSTPIVEQLTNDFVNFAFAENGFSGSLKTIFNNRYTKTVRAMNVTDLIYIYDPTGQAGVGQNTSIVGIDMLEIKCVENDDEDYAVYYLANDFYNEALWYVGADGKINIGAATADRGIRPIVSLKPTVTTSGKDASGVWQLD